MDTIPAVFLVIGAAFVWLGLTAIAMLRLRRRRSGSTLVRSATAPADQAPGRPDRPMRRRHAIPDRNAGVPVRRRRLKVRKVRRERPSSGKRPSSL
ncbi:hypothetical protein ACFC25_17105 [Pseudarthrobacter sp. NPDC055928]|uniref:hypothetical protein n=1 Tax=unclassified Pseudarthrobacter TaxID=2647000 RepID=UPI003077EEC3